MTTVPTLLVLLGAATADELVRLQSLVQARESTTLCFLQRGEPSLVKELNRLAGDGEPEVKVVPVNAGRSATGRSWAFRVAGYWLRTWGAEMDLRMARSELKAPFQDLDDFLAAAAWQRVCGRDGGLTSPSWDEVPGYRHQVLVCQGPRCLARGAGEVTTALQRLLAERGLGDDEVLLTATGCQFPCNQAPLVTVQPDDIWYGNLDDEGVAALVAEHLCRAEPPAQGRSVQYRLRRSRGTGEPTKSSPPAGGAVRRPPS